jgi:glycosyltransferase involved in cell wall biosynthesis
MLYKLLQAADKSKFSFRVVSLSDDGPMGARIRSIGVPVHTFDLSPRFGLPAEAARLKKQIQDFQSDLLQGWMYHGNVVAALISKILPETPRVVWNVRHSLYDISHEKRLTRWMIRLGALLSRVPEAIIYNSNTSAEQHEAIGYDGVGRIFLPNGFDVEIFRPRSEMDQDIRARFEIPDSAFVVGHVARYHPMKDHSGFLRALAHTREQTDAVDVRGLLIGRNVDTDNGNLTSDIEDLNLEGHVHLAGQRDDIPQLMRAMDLFVLSSAYGEGFPNVLGEAMACGVPCVTTDVGEAAKIVGDAGLVVPPRNSEALANALAQFAQTEPEKYQVLAQRARQRIVTQYSIEAVAERYTRLYGAVCADEYSEKDRVTR